jgi:hypothetical protein
MKKNYIFTLLLTFIAFTSFGQNLIISGVYDAGLTGGTPKGVELYVLEDISDLSIYGLGSANNGGGTDGEEFEFPNVSVTKGTFIYVATEDVQFTAFFGMAPDYISGAMAINGDDAVELFMNDAVIDLIGDIDVDGNDEAWEYLDGWAYRNSGSSPSATFNISEWSFSGPNALDGETANSTAATPFPIGTYTNTTASVKNNSIEGFATYPNPVTNNVFSIKSNSSDIKEISIFNVLGKQVLFASLSGVQSDVDVSSISAGLYILKVTEGTKIATTKLVIK